jgi:hypothetical protein
VNDRRHPPQAGLLGAENGRQKASPPTSNAILRCTKLHQEQNAAEPPCGLLRNIFLLTPFRSAGGEFFNYEVGGEECARQTQLMSAIPLASDDLEFTSWKAAI